MKKGILHFFLGALFMVVLDVFIYFFIGKDIIDKAKNDPVLQMASQRREMVHQTMKEVDQRLIPHREKTDKLISVLIERGVLSRDDAWRAGLIDRHSQDE